MISYISPETFNILFRCYVRPHLEFAVQAWSPHLRKDKDKLERVQRRATKLIPEYKNLPYEERLIRLNLPLENRRVRGDLIETFKIIKGLEQMDKAKFFIENTNNLRGNACKLYKKQCRKDIRKHFFSLRVVDDWNRLPDHSVNVKQLKKRLDDFINSQHHE